MVGTVRQRRLFEQGQHVLVAVSGGPDSVALLSLLHQLASSWGLALTAAHFNYGLRGRESDGDEAFVVSLCRGLDVPLHTQRLPLGLRRRGVSIQAAARQLRYEALKTLARECGADRIAVGHTADDQAETVLLWALRGAGLAGLGGMPPSREGVIIRPLYDVTRQDVLAYLDGVRVRYRQDSSNAKPVYLRNRIRHEVMPVLKRIVPSGAKALCRLADLCRADERYLAEEVRALCATELRRMRGGGWVLDRSFLQPLPLALQRRVVREALRRCDSQHRAASAESVDRVIASLTKSTSRRADLKSVRVTVTATQVAFTPVGQGIPERDGVKPLEPSEINIPSLVTWAGTGQQIHVRPLSESSAAGRPVEPSRSIVLDADRFSGPLVVRSWRPGDRFCPLGMNGRSKKIQDLFTDLKVPIEQRATVPILEAPEGIVWVVGYRQDERFVPHRSTRRRVLVTVTNPR
jgi:tRNA(Ile)-lysidine synthase